MAHTLVGLNFEGSTWFYTVLNEHTYVTKGFGWRWSDILWQVPTLVSVKYFEWVPYEVNLLLLSYSYTLHPILGVFLCFWIVRKEKDAVFYMTFPLLSLGTAVACNIAFVVGIANGAITLFWPLFFIFCFKDVSKTKYAVPALILLLALSVNYEPAVAFMPILAWVILKSSSYRPRKPDVLFLVLLSISFGFQIVRINFEYFNQTQWLNVFWHAALNKETSLFHFYLMGIAVVLFFSLFLYSKSERASVLFAGAFICLLAVIVWSRKTALISLMESRENRASAIPIAAAIAVSLAYVRYFQNSKQTKNLFCYILGISIISFFASSFYLSHNISDWNSYVNKVQQITHNEVGCIHIKNISVANSTAFASILFQRTENPNVILLASDMNCSDEIDHNINPCDRYIAESIEKDFHSACRSLYISSANVNLIKTKQQSKVKVSHQSFLY